MPETRPLRTGDPREVGGFRLTSRIGEGAQGAVFLGESATGRRVAVKLLYADFGRDARARTAFERELAAARRVAPFCTARILAASADDDLPHIVTEYIDGPSLKDLIAERGVASPAELVRLAIGTATALAAIHEAGVVHRDFKPANVLLGPDGPKVIDFGIARPLDATSATMTGAVGTPAYMAPEQVAGVSGGAPVDMFAWGCTMAFAANGAPPFGTDSVPAIMQRILHGEPELGALTGQLRELVASCLAKDPADRLPATGVLQRLLGIGPDANLLAEGTSAAAHPAGALLPETTPAGAPAGAPSFAAPDAPPPPGMAPGGPLPPPAGFPYAGSPPPPGRNGRPLLIAGAAATGALLLASGLVAVILLKDGGSGKGGEPVARTAPAARTCSYPPSTSTDVKSIPTPSARVPDRPPTHATIKTNLGDLELTLEPGAAPCTVNSLAFLASRGFYDRTSCHRLTTTPSLKVLQCGDPSGTGTGGPSYQFADENTAGASYTKGTVAMANRGPNTNGSQFFILYEDAPQLPHSYPIFGHITSGMDIIEKVAKKGVEDGTEDGRPKQKVTITQISTSAT
ncbi:protein kinase domain-containing protein [Actinomadura formosensis]|uniref:protein kinase domain-containing protein n=1 Tax=Actinomadura formosensis TaxID=60706 RepID=UPI000832D239|nr:peptidylprolyl isomerase [Actinomadura formosensis]